MIEVRNLTKVYKNKSFRKSKRKNIVAIDDISMDIKKEEIYGLIGPNGAGKTTFIKTLSTLILPDSGDVMINGHDLVKDAKKVRDMIGVVTGDYSRSLYWRLTGKQNIKFFGNLYDMDRQDIKRRTDELLVKFGLEDRANDLVMNYSTGMKHKLSLARALLTKPPILLLDEPTTGIDPKSSYEIKKYIKEDLSETTVVWTSHNLYEIEEVCDRVGMIDKGSLVLEGDPDELKTRYYNFKKMKIVLEDPETDSLISRYCGEAKKIDEHTLEIETMDINKTIKDIMDLNFKILEVQTLKPTLEEIFIDKLTGEGEC